MGVRLSGGAPKNNTMRQRHGNSGGNASSEDLDDDASSVPAENSAVNAASGGRLGLSRAFELALWVLSSAFVVYHGDVHSNFVSLLIWDSRIKRGAFNVGSVCLVLDCAIILYTTWWRIKDDDTSDLSTSTAVQRVVTTGLLSFLIFSIALWLIWSFLTLPLLKRGKVLCYDITGPAADVNMMGYAISDQSCLTVVGTFDTNTIGRPKLPALPESYTVYSSLWKIP